MDERHYTMISYRGIYVFMLCVCLTKSELCAKWENKEAVSNDGHVFRVIQPSGYSQCWKECKLSTECGDIAFNREQLYCGLIRKSVNTPSPMDLSEFWLSDRQLDALLTDQITQLGPCATLLCGVDERCVELKDGSGLCIHAVKCDGGYFQNRCIFEGPSPGSWTVGRDQCGQLGGSLVTIESTEVNSLILTLTTTNVWAGGNDLGTEGIWTWIENNHQIVITSLWAANKPSTSWTNANCLAVMSSGVWYDVDCSGSRAYFCQTYLTQ